MTIKFIDVVADVLTGLENGTYEPGAGEDDWAKGDEDFQEAVNLIHKALRRAGDDPWTLLAAEAFIRKARGDVDVADLEDWMSGHHVWSGAGVADALEGYAQKRPKGSDLRNLFDVLDWTGGMGAFDWKVYADSGAASVSGLNFVEVPDGSAHIFLDL